MGKGEWRVRAISMPGTKKASSLATHLHLLYPTCRSFSGSETTKPPRPASPDVDREGFQSGRVGNPAIPTLPPLGSERDILVLSQNQVLLTGVLFGFSLREGSSFLPGWESPNQGEGADSAPPFIPTRGDECYSQNNITHVMFLP